jgi:hypothetical protein
MNGENDLMGGLSAAVQPMAPAAPAFTPEQIAQMQAGFGTMRQNLQAASDPNRNAAFNQYVADQAAKGIEVGSTYAGGGGPLGSGGIFGVTDFAPAFDPANPGATTGQVVRFDEGDRNAPVVFQPGQNYVLTDASGKNVVGRASSMEEMQALVAAQKKMPYGFQLHQADAQGNFQPGMQLFGESDPRAEGAMGALVKYGLPIAASFVPGLNVLTGAALAGGTTAAGNLMTGETPKKALISGLIAAGTQGVLKGTGLDKVIGNALPFANRAAETGVNVAAQQGAQNAIQQGIEQGLITVTNRVGSNVLGNLASGAISSGLGNIGGSLAADTSLGRLADAYNQPPAAEGALQPELMSTASRAAPTSGASMAGTLVPNLLPYIPGYTGGEELLSTAPRPDSSSGWALPAAATGAGGAALAAGAGPGVTTYSPPPSVETMQANAANMPAAEPMITVTAPTGATGSLNAALPGLAMAVPAMTAANAVTGGAAGSGISGTAKKVIGGLSALELITDLLGISTGRGKGTPGVGALGPGAASLGTPASLGSVFNAKLPSPGAAFSAQSFAPRDMSGVDFSRYGYGPAQSFFENVPRSPQEYRDALAARTAPPATAQPQSNDIAGYIRRLVPGVTDAQIDAVMQSPEGRELLGLDPAARPFARGGMLMSEGGTSSDSRAVKGPGTGRSDEIPALLSDGEYVIDAETVAMLGDGSSEAGAKRLDDFRVSIRKHKGRNLAKGEFSANAKRPENYLSGGRV